MFEQDYIMLLISEIIRTLLKLLFHINTKKEHDFLYESEMVSEKYEKLLDMIDAGLINEAENLLLEELNPHDLNDYKTALLFYSYLNDKDDVFLEQSKYSRAEITEGIQITSKIFGYDKLTASVTKLFLGGI